MSANKTNLSNIVDYLLPLKNKVFFVWPEKKKKKTLDMLHFAFNKLLSEIKAKINSKTKASDITEEILKLLGEEDFNEYEFTQKLLSLISISSDDQKFFVEEKKILNEIIKRSQPFWVTELEAKKRAKLLSKEEILKHDLKILSSDLQFYALDYFLLMFKTLKEKNLIEKIEIIFKGINSLPSLYGDATEEDMLNKIAYALYDINTRHQMINDYYKYKNIFLNLDEMANLKEDEVAVVEKVLKDYIFSLIKLSQDYNIMELNQGTYFPYGEKISFESLKKLLN